MNNNLLSLLIISYNQEKFIEYALMSALCQEYNNYEIVISDDCSTDNTWDIIERTLQNVNFKKPNIILNRNNENLGIVRNFQKALSLTKGIWIVGMAGDDISKPNRLKVINELSQINEHIYAIGTGYDIINSRGKYLAKNVWCVRNEINLPMYPGFSAAIKRDTFLQFPEINSNIQSEDIIYTLRAFELGGILLSNVSTVKYRIHSDNITSKGTSVKEYKGKILNHLKAIETLEYFKVNELRNKKLAPIIDMQVKKYEENIKYFNSVIDFYGMNLLNKIQNLSSLHPYNNYNTLYFKIKILFDSYKLLSNVLKSIKNLKVVFNILRGIKKGGRKENSDFKIYHIN